MSIPIVYGRTKPRVCFCRQYKSPQPQTIPPKAVFEPWPWLFPGTYFLTILSTPIAFFLSTKKRTLINVPSALTHP